VVSFTKVLIFGSAFLSTTVPVTIETVLNDVTAIDANGASLIAATSALDRALISPSLHILVDIGSIYAALFKGDFNSGFLTSSLSNRHLGTHQPGISALAIDEHIALKRLESKKPYFQDAGLNAFVVAALGLLKTGHDFLSANVLEKIWGDAAVLRRRLLRLLKSHCRRVLIVLTCFREMKLTSFRIK
jgi:hypothetical protein